MKRYGDFISLYDLADDLEETGELSKVGQELMDELAEINKFQIWGRVAREIGVTENELKRFVNAVYLHPDNYRYRMSLEIKTNSFMVGVI